MQMDYGASSLSQWFFAELLSSGMYQDYLSRLRKELRRRRDHALFVLSLHFHDLAKWNTPKGGFYIWLTIKGAPNMELLFQKAAKLHILLNPGDIYDFDHNHSLRLSYAYTSCDEFERAAIKLARMIRDEFT